MRRATFASIVAGIVMLLGIGGAAAAPVNNPHAEFYDITCGDETYQIVVGGGNPAHILGSTSRLIPFQFTFTAVDPVTGEPLVDPETGEPLFSETETLGNGQRKGVQGDLVSCTTGPITFIDPEFGEMTFTIEVLAFLTPRGK